jgi:hypothetical protein
MLRSFWMELCDVITALGEERFRDLLRNISISRLRTYQLFERTRDRCRLTKLNTEHLRKAEPRLWERISQKDEDLASDLSQGLLVSHLEMIIEALNLLGIPHQDGFFAKDADTSKYLSEGWERKVYDALKEKHPPSVLVFYINHLGLEAGKLESVFAPAA